MSDGLVLPFSIEAHVVAELIQGQEGSHCGRPSHVQQVHPGLVVVRIGRKVGDHAERIACPPKPDNHRSEGATRIVVQLMGSRDLSRTLARPAVQDSGFVIDESGALETTVVAVSELLGDQIEALKGPLTGSPWIL
nr:hypothetical protein [uncultured Brevundimonas sp.]